MPPAVANTYWQNAGAAQRRALLPKAGILPSCKVIPVPPLLSHVVQAAHVTRHTSHVTRHTSAHATMLVRELTKFCPDDS